MDANRLHTFVLFLLPMGSGYYEIFMKRKSCKLYLLALCFLAVLWPSKASAQISVRKEDDSSLLVQTDMVYDFPIGAALQYYLDKTTNSERWTISIGLAVNQQCVVDKGSILYICTEEGEIIEKEVESFSYSERQSDYYSLRIGSWKIDNDELTNLIESHFVRMGIQTSIGFLFADLKKNSFSKQVKLLKELIESSASFDSNF